MGRLTRPITHSYSRKTTAFTFGNSHFVLILRNQLFRVVRVYIVITSC